LFEQIKRLDSATILSNINNTQTVLKYWVPKFHQGVTSDTIKNCIKESIVSRTVSDVPVVLFLSGGVDSSAVAAILKKIDAVHLISPEVDSAQAIANLYNMKFRIVEPTNFDIRLALHEYSEFSGEATMSGFIPYITCKEISDKYKVAITANGADELFFGYTRIPTPTIPNSFFENRMMNNRINVNGNALDADGQFYQIFRHPSNFSIPILDKTKGVSDLIDLVNSELSTFNQNNDFPETSKYRWFELMTYIKGDLNNTLDFSSMANSVEVRAPFLDYKLVELSLSLDERHHVSHKNGRKHFLKEILHEEKVPDNIWERDKIGFSLIESYLTDIEYLKNEAVSNLQKEGYLTLDCTHKNKERDLIYLKSAALGFYYWKSVWIDSGIVQK